MTQINYHWTNEDYFKYLTQHNRTAVLALEYLVDDLHAGKEATINKFLTHTDIETLLWNLFRLLSYTDPRVAGNSAYVIGSIAETECGIIKILALLVESLNEEKDKILTNMANMLRSNDTECLMNAAGTIGTLLENKQGRDWILSQPPIDDIIQLSTNLLDNQNTWISSNAALVLARISIEECGCKKLLTHQYVEIMMKNLIDGLRTDNTGRSMNCAFTIGRLCGSSEDLETFLKYNNDRSMKKLIYLLCSIVEQNLEYNLTKNACFALSCLADHKPTYNLIIQHTSFNVLANSLSYLIGNADDLETLCFAAMLLRILACSVDGCVKLRQLEIVESTLKKLLVENVYPEIEEEIRITLQYLKRLEKPNPPQVEFIGTTNVCLKWERTPNKNKLNVQYSLYADNICIYTGPETAYNANNLSPYTQYIFQLQLVTIEDNDRSQLSDSCVVTTDESIPTAPLRMRCVGSMTSLMKIGWDPPDKMNGACKGYFIYKDGKHIDQTCDVMYIVTGLIPSTVYEIAVCAATAKGKGPKAVIRAATCELGDVVPDRPSFAAIGKREILVRWGAPKTLAGKLNHYDLFMNDKCIYSGMSLEHQVIMLKPDTEYKFHVSAITNEGKFKSKVSKVQTLRDEYDPERAPLYPGNLNKRVSQDSMPDVAATSRQSVSRAKSFSKALSIGSSLQRDDSIDLDDPYLKSFSDSITLPPVNLKQNEEVSGNNEKRPSQGTIITTYRGPTQTQMRENTSIASYKSSSLTRGSIDGRNSRSNYFEASQVSYNKVDIKPLLSSSSNPIDRTRATPERQIIYATKTPTSLLRVPTPIKLRDSSTNDFPSIEPKPQPSSHSPIITYLPVYNHVSSNNVNTNTNNDQTRSLAIYSSMSSASAATIMHQHTHHRQNNNHSKQLLLPNEADRVVNNFVPLQYRYPSKKTHRQRTLY